MPYLVRRRRSRRTPIRRRTFKRAYTLRRPRLIRRYRTKYSSKRRSYR